MQAVQSIYREITGALKETSGLSNLIVKPLAVAALWCDRWQITKPHLIDAVANMIKPVIDATDAVVLIPDLLAPPSEEAIYPVGGKVHQMTFLEKTAAKVSDFGEWSLGVLDALSFGGQVGFVELSQKVLEILDVAFVVATLSVAFFTLFREFSLLAEGSKIENGSLQPLTSKDVALSLIKVGLSIGMIALSVIVASSLVGVELAFEKVVILTGLTVGSFSKTVIELVA